VRIIMRMAFYCTPIIYSLDTVPEPLRKLLWANPMSGVLELYRAGLFNEPLVIQPIIACVVMTAGFLVVGATVFKRLERSVLKEI